MRALQVIASLSDARGGPSLAVRGLALALKTQHIDTDIVTTDDGLAGAANTTPGQLEAIGGGQVIRFRRQTDFYSVSVSLCRWLLQNASHYDVVHVHGLFNFVSAAAAFAARAAGKPYVLTPHGTLHQWGLSQRRPQLKRLSMWMLESHIIAGATRVHFTSEFEQQEARKFCAGSSSTIIPLGVDLAAMERDLPALAPAGVPDDAVTRPTLLFLSRIDPIKRLDLLLHAVQELRQRLPSVLLLVAGSGDPELVRSLRTLASRLDIDSNVAWLGFVSGGQKRWLLQHCRLMVLPSYSENFGLAVVEAAANGMPVIVSSTVGIAPLIVRYGAGDVCPADASGLAEVLCDWLTSEQRQRLAALAGRNLVAEELSLEVLGKRIETLYRSVVRT